jgi:glutamate synthase (NADPH/NADH)
MSESENMVRSFKYHPSAQGLYDPKQEKGACGVGMIADLKGTPTRDTVANALEILVNLDHRGARGCDEGSGDGAGILCSMPDAFFRRVVKDLPPLRQYAVGMVFFDKGSSTIGDAKRLFSEFAKSLDGIRVAGWRKVPTCNDSLGNQAKTFEPHIEQVIVTAEGECSESEDKFAATLYSLRQIASAQINQRLTNCSFYVCSLSPKTITYKGMLTPEQVPLYFPDLTEEDFQAHVAVVHSRFATNTFPSWDKSHPYRLLAHNGEINTIAGNCNWMIAREQHMKSDIIPNIESTFPLFSEDQSDTSRLDSVMECIHLSGRSLTETVCLMVPQAWEKIPNVSDEMRDWFKMQAAVMEPWDGPACLCYTDSNTAGAALDRNGLRPCRYYLTHDQRLIIGSEAGVLPDSIQPDDVAEKGRLLPGNVMSIDFKEHRIYHNDEIKQALASKQPYGQWIREEGFTLDDVKPYAHRPSRKFSWNSKGNQWKNKDDGYRVGDPSDQGLRAFGYTTEALEMLLQPMAEKASEAMGSMGNDTPLSCLSDLPRPVFDFFYQRFAQVSNPPMDPIRESIVMSLSAWVGPEQNLLSPLSRMHCRRLWLDHPCLLPSDMNAIYGMGGFRGWNFHTVDMTFPVAEGTRGLQRHLVRVCNEACDAIRFGNCQIIVLSDRTVARDRAPIPSLLCTGAVHQALVREKLRLNAAIVTDSGEPFEVHHHCLLATFGADAVCPYNAYEALLKIKKDDMLAKPMDDDKLFENYKAAVGLGILKVMAKMGIACLQSYKGAQIAEPVGLHDDITKLCFTGSYSQVGGLNFVDIADRVLRLHARGFPLNPLPKSQLCSGLDNDGKYHLRQGAETEIHMNDPMLIAKMQEAARTNSRAAYAQFAQIHNRLVNKATLRGQLELRDAEEFGMSSIPIEEVETVSDIVKRFRTGAMSYGSISMEAHATLAIAMNKIGGKSNTGEGGEDPARFELMDDGSSANSAIKQLASGRFGVHMEYLTNARELQIKMAQGAKPGEGGELPGYKVLPHIAACRNSTPGVGLVSPPPHHDIYSIEDLAQLIHDCKNANPKAEVSVKLVSELGVGVVAAGVAKCKADHILISGCEGGTGASKWTGIKSAGASWELGLAESHQALVLNGLRGRVSLETDGQLRTGRDVVIAALLGAEQFGFATAPLIAMGCIMMRKCHLNTCPVGIATQDPVLRAKFEGMPEHVSNYLLLVAEEARTLMAKLGFRTMDELIGRAEVLTVNPSRFFQTPLEMEKLLAPAHKLPDAGLFGPVENRKMYPQDHSNVLAPGSAPTKLVEAFQDTLKSGKTTKYEMDVRNLDRTLGTALSHEIQKTWDDTLPAGTCHAKLTGTAGQSLGAFAVKGLFLELEGDSQDFVGKGLSGGALAIYPQKSSLALGFKAEENVIVGNTALFGATKGVALIRGLGGDRFAVRNSGAWAVVEGVGDHCCEYMTGGRVVVLGKVGPNFAAGMSGGIAWAWDPDNTFSEQVNHEMVVLTRMDPDEQHPACPQDGEDLKTLLEAHRHFTGSTVAGSILARWPGVLTEFVRVFPEDYKQALEKTDRGAADTSRFQSWLPPFGDGAVPETLAERKPRSASVVAKENKKQQVFKMPELDIEDIGLKFSKLQKEVDDKKLEGNHGFVKFARAEIKKRSVAERARDFVEIYDHNDKQKVKTQAARCMDCGTPFCHQSVTIRSGCPLGNLIPEWNALVKKDDWYNAFQRLRLTNNFPEFTGRVCPAPCEASCTLGIIDDPVGIKSVELAIVDEAYRQGWMEPRVPPQRTGLKVAIIGAGPAGMAAADELNRMGHTVTVYERSDRAGGLMMYGVPNMKTDKEEYVQRRVNIMIAEGITFVCGQKGHIGGSGGPTSQELLDSSDAVLLATGATVGRDLDNVPGRGLKGVHLAMEFLHGNTKAILDSGAVDSTWREKSNLASRPPIDVAGKQVCVIGGGDTGNDCIGTSVRHGAKSVANLELLPKPPPSRAPETPWPHWPTKYRTDYGHEEAAQLLNNGEDIRIFSVQTKEFVGDADGNVKGLKIVDLEWKVADGRMQMKEVAGSERELPADNVFLALGFLGPEGPLAKEFGVKVERGNYKASFGREADSFRTSNPKVFAAGDCRRGQSLVVWGITEGRQASEAIQKYLQSLKPREQ